MNNPYSPPLAIPHPEIGLLQGDAAPATRGYGGIRRLPYLGILVGINVVKAVLLSDPSDYDTFLTGTITMFLVAATLFTISSRVVNLGMKRWTCLLMFVPLVNIWLGFRCALCPEGYADTKQLDTGGRVAACILLVLGALAASFILLAALIGT